MKVGILTLRFHSNFGFIMQAYAMQKVLKEMGHEPYHYYTRVEQTSYLNRFKQTIKNGIDILFKGKQTPLFYYWPSNKDYDVIDKYTNEFINEHIQLTPYFKNVKELSSYDTSKFDAFIVGSDQVWREQFSLNITTYFFDFVPEEKPRMSYAASFGIPQLDYTDQEKRICKELLSKFKIVTVRESDAVDICKKEFGVEAKCVLDPTLLIKKDVYSHLADRGAILNDGKPYIFAYILEYNDSINQFIKEASEKYNLPVINLLPENYSFSSRSNLNSLVYPPIYDILRGFRDAEFVITDSFHGTAFSIILNKVFSSYIHPHRGSSRITSILSMLDLNDRLENMGFSGDAIDYSRINKILETKREESIEVLKSFFV